MMNIKYKILGTFMIITLFVTSCNDFGDMNVDPNEPTEVPAETLVTQGMFTLPDLYWGRNVNFEFGMLMAQHFAQAEYTEEQRYILPIASFDAEWVDIYAESLMDLRTAKGLIEESTTVTEAQRANQIAVIDIMESFGFMLATDIWGDIPYSQALKPDEFVQPAYDTQADVYAGLIATVSAAVDNISTSDAGFSATADIIYNGDMDGWQKFGNALLLRMGMRVADVDAALAGQAVTKALSGNIIAAVEDQASLVYRTENALANPFWFDASPAGGTRDDFRISAELVDWLKSHNDPRLAMYADPTPTGAYIGMPYGLGDNAAFALKNQTSRFAESIREATAPAYMMRYSEVKFLEAEAILRGLVSGDQTVAYAEGITAAMNEWGISDEDAIAAYITANPFSADNHAEQMWVSLYTNGIEAWSTWRRLDHPNLEAPATADINTVPLRGLYPTDEQATNEANLTAVEYDNVMTVRLWWDVD